MGRCLGYPCLFLVPPCLGLRSSGSLLLFFVGWPSGVFRWAACWLLVLSFSFCGVFAVSFSSSAVVARSLSPLSCVVWSRPVVVSRLGWCASSRSVLVWVSGSASPLACRVGRSAPASVSALVASLRAARASGAPVSLGVRSGWSPARWFCAVAPASSRALAS